ncbi:hypothetical protein [Amycolatopsis sp. NPDC051371]
MSKTPEFFEPAGGSALATALRPARVSAMTGGRRLSVPVVAGCFAVVAC